MTSNIPWRLKSTHVHHAVGSPPYGEEPSQKLWTYKVCWPDLWAKMCYRVPGAATAGRYARTPLYGFGDLEEGKPEGLDWRETTYARLLALDGADRQTWRRSR